MKRLLLLFFIAATTLSAAEAQVQRELKTEDNGFKWYQTHSGSYYGAESIDGRTIIPLSKGYDMIVFHNNGDCIGYFGVYRNGKKGAYDIHGNLVIEPIHEKLYYLTNGFCYEDAYGTDHYLGITLDANGRASSASGSSSYTPSSSGSYGSQRGNKTLQTENNGFKWYKTSSGNYQGAESTDGRTLISLSQGYSSVVFHEKKDCIGYFSVYKNGKKGAYDIHGNLVIEPIHEKLYYLTNGFCYEDAYGTDHYLGITLDANGRASSYGYGASSASTYTPSTSSTSTVSSSSSSESSIDFIFNYYYDGVTGKNVFALDKENKYFFCGQFIMRYEFYNSYFKIILIAANRRDGTEREVERHVIYPAQCTIVVKSSEHIIVWNDGGKDRNVFVRPEKNMVFLYDVSDLKQQHLFNGKAEGTINTLFNTLSSDSDAEGCTITIEKDYSGKCNRLISRLLQYSWGKKTYK